MVKESRLSIDLEDSLERFSICLVCTGMNLEEYLDRTMIKDLPRMHGDEPLIAMTSDICYTSTPHALG